MAYPPVAEPVADAATPARKRTTHQTAAFLETARARFQQWEDADATQCEHEADDTRFYNLDQWPEAIRKARQRQEASGGLPAVPARPCFVIDQTHEPVQQILDQGRGADLGVELVPAEDFGDLGVTPDDHEVTLREGLLRRIQRALEASDARLWAFFRALVTGRGYYGVLTRYLPGKTWDQEIYLHRFLNQAAVAIDPNHEEPDGSDARWGFVGVDLPWDDYRADFPDAAEDLVDDDAFRAAGDVAPGWFTSSGDQRTCRVTDYWYTERTPRTLVKLTDGRALWEDELPEDVPDGAIVDRREVVEQTIKWAKIDGHQVLEETDWPGPDLPIVKILYEELLPVDGERPVHGVVRPMRDSCEGANAMASKLVEVVGLTPIPPLVLDPESIDGYEKWYEASTTRTLPFLPARTRDDEGREFREPHRPAVDPPIAAIAGALEMFKQGVQTTSRVHDPSLGKVDPSIKSGKALVAYQQQSLRATSGALSNLKRAMRYEAQVINNLLFAIYGTPGRIVRILNGEGEPERVTISPPPVPGQSQGMPPPQGAAPQYRLTKDAGWNVVVKITQAADTRRQEETSIIASLLSANPQFITWFGDLFFKNQDGPGHAEMAERAKAMLDPKIQQLLASKSQGAAIPPQVQQQLQQQQEQLQHAEALLQKAQQEIGGEERKYASAEKIAQMKIASDERQSAATNETKIAVAELGAKVDRLGLFLEERARLGVEEQAHADRAHDVGMAALDHHATLDQAAQQHAHALAQGQQQVQGDAALADQGQQHALDSAQQAAELQPAPETETPA